MGVETRRVFYRTTAPVSRFQLYRRTLHKGGLILVQTNRFPAEQTRIKYCRMTVRERSAMVQARDEWPVLWSCLVLISRGSVGRC